MMRVQSHDGILHDQGINLLHQMILYLDEDGTWFGLNPMLAEARQLA